MKSLPWFRAYTEMVDDEKLRLLAFEDRWHFVALLCLKGQGLIDEGGPLLFRKVAVKLGIDTRTLDEVARRIAEVGLIDEVTLQPIAWNSRQMRSDKDMTNAERQARYRDSLKDKKSVSNALRNVTVTRIDTDTDIDKDKEEANASVAVKPAAVAAVQPSCPADDLIDLYHELMPLNPPVRIINDARRKSIRARWKEASLLTCSPFGYSNRQDGIVAWRKFFEVCAESEFLTGRAKAMPGKPPFVADIDFLFSPSGFAKCLENKYHREAA